MSKPWIAITAGEPAGIGPDLVLQIAGHAFGTGLIVIADPALLQERAKQLGMQIKLIPYHQSLTCEQQPGCLVYQPLTLQKPVIPGRPDPANAAYVMDSIQTAVTGCLDGRFAALVTAPVNKAVINQGGYPFSGHTEYIARLCNNVFPVMMLANSKLRVALVTTHLPLSRVADAISAELLERVVSTVHHDLKTRFGIDNPRLLVCGLNPHAGEQGYLGREEIDIISPVLEKLRHRGMAITGPVPADTAFVPANLTSADVVVAMYHDQGLPALKAQGFGETVNITLGLPIIRTSVDHGTAFELAGTGRASSSSLFSAIRFAEQMSRQQAN